MIDALRTASDAVLSIICTLAVFGAASVTCGGIVILLLLRQAQHIATEIRMDRAQTAARYARIDADEIDVEAAC